MRVSLEPQLSKAGVSFFKGTAMHWSHSDPNWQKLEHLFLKGLRYMGLTQTPIDVGLKGTVIHGSHLDPNWNELERLSIEKS